MTVSEPVVLWHESSTPGEQYNGVTRIICTPRLILIATTLKSRCYLTADGPTRLLYMYSDRQHQLMSPMAARRETSRVSRVIM